MMMHLCSALCIVVHPKRLKIMWGGVFPQPAPVCTIHLDDTTAATGQQVEKRESHWANQVDGDY